MNELLLSMIASQPECPARYASSRTLAAPRRAVSPLEIACSPWITFASEITPLGEESAAAFRGATFNPSLAFVEYGHA